MNKEEIPTASKVENEKKRIRINSMKRREERFLHLNKKK